MMESMGMDENITNKKQKKAIVIIKGGFGNQIFQFAFANYLKSLKKTELLYLECLMKL